MTQLSQSIGIPKSNLSYSSKRQIDKSKSKNAQPISKHVMALITFLALLPLVYFIPDVVGQFLPDIKWLNVTVAVGIIVPIMSYIVMPTARLVLSREH
jgi:antibiotic biosynthesis monooxygenase (ABM) superfamily enzyme